MPTAAGADKNIDNSIDLFCKNNTLSFVSLAIDLLRTGKTTVPIAIPDIASGN